jgi:hypothetical protein
MNAFLSKAVIITVGVVCSILAGVGLGLLILGFALVATAIWVQERMED